MGSNSFCHSDSQEHFMKTKKLFESKKTIHRRKKIQIALAFLINQLSFFSFMEQHFLLVQKGGTLLWLLNTCYFCNVQLPLCLSHLYLKQQQSLLGFHYTESRFSIYLFIVEYLFLFIFSCLLIPSTNVYPSMFSLEYCSFFLFGTIVCTTLV